MAQKKGSEEYEVLHDSVDASLPIVVQSAGYDRLLSEAPDGQIFSTWIQTPTASSVQVGAGHREGQINRTGHHLAGHGRAHLCPLQPQSIFLLLAENDRVVAEQDGSWKNYSNFDVHTYVSALSWDEWAARHHIPVVRVPVGFEGIAAVVRQVEAGVARGGPIEVKNELGEAIAIGPNPKLHHAGEESGGGIRRSQPSHLQHDGRKSSGHARKEQR